MKKILTMLTSFSLIATSSVLVVSCKTDDFKKIFETPKNLSDSNKSNENNKEALESKKETLKSDQLKEDDSNSSSFNTYNKDNILSSIEDEREFIYGYNKWLEDGKKGNVDHFFNPKNPNEILLLGFTKEHNGKKEVYKLKSIPTNVNKVPKSLPHKVTSLESAFKNNINENIDGIEFWDTSRITSMYQTFFGAKKFNGDITKWKTENVTNFDYMLSGADSFNRDLSNWNVSKDPFQVGFAKYSDFDNNRNFWPPFKNKNN
uniref:Lipoprotein n=1 Tax=Mycoplasma feriruminatoris TaxID=1179777 RepID=A0A654IRC4_9MOLU|nr:hypothetical protein MF5582_00720 [Mycoplasma feriruminatoris]